MKLKPEAQQMWDDLDDASKAIILSANRPPPRIQANTASTTASSLSGTTPAPKSAPPSDSNSLTSALKQAKADAFPGDPRAVLSNSGDTKSVTIRQGFHVAMAPLPDDESYVGDNDDHTVDHVPGPSPDEAELEATKLQRIMELYGHVPPDDLSSVDGDDDEPPGVTLRDSESEEEADFQ